MTEGGPKFEQTTAETWMAAFEEAKALNDVFFNKMLEVYGEEGAEKHHDFFLKLWRELQRGGETTTTIKNIAVVHAFDGSTISAEYFRPGVSRIDLPGENSILAAVRAKLKELEQ